MIADRPIIGIFFIVGFCIFAPMGDAAAKAISLATPMMMILLFRYSMQFALPIPIIPRPWYRRFGNWPIRFILGSHGLTGIRARRKVRR